MQLSEIIGKIKGVSVLCVGDIMLDCYSYGTVSRTAPESDAPILHVERDEKMLGGAGNVLSNLASLGAKVHAAGIVGEDMAAQSVLDILESQHIDTECVLRDTNRPTITKTRYVNQEGEHLVRVDYEDKTAINAELEDRLYNSIAALIADQDVVVMSDYNKGLLTDQLLARLIKLAQAHDVPVIIDPKGNDYSKYKGATMLTPNKKELAEVSGAQLDGHDDIASAARTVIENAELDALLVTLSEEGGVLFEKGSDDFVSFPAQAKCVKQVSGAGDSVVAALAVALGGGANKAQASQLAILAGSIAVEQADTSLITAQALKERTE